MADFRKRLLGLAGAAVAFSGMAFGQANCTGTAVGGAAAGTVTAGTSGPAFLRAEGQTELLAQMVFTCNIGAVAAPASAGLAAGATVNLQVFISPGVTITSKLLSAPLPAPPAGSFSSVPAGATEAVATSSSSAAAISFGVVSGTSLIFNNIPVAAAAGGTVTITVSNVRINASGIPTTAGAPPTPVVVQGFVTTGTNNSAAASVSPGATAQLTAGYVLTGFGGAKLFKDFANTSSFSTSDIGVCGGLGAQDSSNKPTPAFFVQVTEGFQSAFKTLADEQSQVAITTSAPFVTTVVPPAAFPAGAVNAATSGTRIKLTFANVPSTGLSIYLPLSVTATDGAVLTLIQAETGGFNAATANTSFSGLNGPGNQFSSTAPNLAAAGNGVGQVAISGTGATAVYEVTTDILNAIDVFSIPVYYNAGGNSIAAQTATESVSVSLAPITAATTIPSFVANAASYTTVNTNTFSVCQTSLLFPFVTNAGGVFETGIAISNTTKDPGSTKPQAGTCSLSFYGMGTSNAPAPATLANAPNGNEPAVAGVPAVYQGGETYLFTLSQAVTAANAAAGVANDPRGFSGYMIAKCGFQDAHGFAYIIYNPQGASTIASNSASTTMGYLALVLSRGSNSPEQLNN
jgi:hypothetical protein